MSAIERDNVKRWRVGMQVERSTAAALLETEKGFRRIKGCKHMAVLVTALATYQGQQQTQRKPLLQVDTPEIADQNQVRMGLSNSP